MLTPHASSEYGSLQCVAMRYAGAFTRALAGPDIHPVLARQMTTSTWAPYDVQKVRAQQKGLIGVLRGHGTEVILLDEAPGCSAQHYPRDLAFVIDGALFFARLNSAHRQPETQALAQLVDRLPNVVPLSEGTIEGGDVMLHTGTVLVGRSEETSHAGIKALQRALEITRSDREVVPVHFCVAGIVHLDDHFNIVAPHPALIHRSVFPPAQICWFEKHFDLIDVTDEEARAVQANVLALAPGTVIVAEGSDRIAERLAGRGIEVLTVDYSEVTKVPGGLRCSTLPLLRG